MKQNDQIPTIMAISAPSESDLDSLYYDCSNIGCGFVSKPRQDATDPESAIIRTTRLGRYNPRILWGAITWIRDNSDLVNPRKLEHRIPKGDPAVLGAMLDIALANGADKALKHILPECKPKNERELLFQGFIGNPLHSQMSVEKALPEWLKWGLYCYEIDFLKIMFDRERILKHNKLLAIRAVVGPNVRAEILYYLYKNTRSYASELCRKIGFTYPTVYIESQRMASNGFLSSERIGKTILLSLAPKGRNLLAAI